MPPGGFPPGPPFSEGTGAICRVPSLGFLPSPERIARLFPCVGLGYGAGEVPPRPWTQAQRSRLSVFPGDARVPLGSSQIQPQGQDHPVQRSCFPWVERLRALLRDRFTLRRFTERRNPGTFGDPGFHRISSYSCQHSHFRHLQWTSRSTFIGPRNVPLPTGLDIQPSAAASVRALSPDTSSVAIPSTSALLRVLQRMAASKPTSWLSLGDGLPFPLMCGLGTLACDLGCFPFDLRSSHRRSVYLADLDPALEDCRELVKENLPVPQQSSTSGPWSSGGLPP